MKLIRKIGFLVIMSVLTACGETPPDIYTSTSAPSPSVTILPQPKPTDESYIGHKEFQPYVNLFVWYAWDRGQDYDLKNTEIWFSELPGYPSTTIGVCRLSSRSNPRVTIRSSWWNRVSVGYRELVILHELGHCTLRRTHRTTKTSSGIPVSIMYPSIFSPTTYNKYKEAYLSELYTQGYTLGVQDIDYEHVCSSHNIGH